MKNCHIFLISIVVCFYALLITVTISHKHESHNKAPSNANKNTDNTKKMHNARMSQDFEHIVEHLKEKINIKKEMSPEELEFHYFM